MRDAVERGEAPGCVRDTLKAGLAIGLPCAVCKQVCETYVCEPCAPIDKGRCASRRSTA